MKPIKISKIFIHDENDVVIMLKRFKASFRIMVNKTFENNTLRTKPGQALENLYKAMYQQIVIQKIYTDLPNAFL